MNHAILGMGVGVNELLVGFPLVIVWIWTLIECIKRKQFIWLVAVFFTFMLGVIAYWLFGRGSRPASAQS
jgi:hypothetical protein